MKSIPHHVLPCASHPGNQFVAKVRTAPIFAIFCIWIAFVSSGSLGKGSQSSQNAPAALIEAFHSYAPVADVEQTLRRNGLSWSIVEDSRLPVGDKRPRFDILRISVAHFYYLGHLGELQFQFFNNRLMSTSFYPNDPASFARVLETRLKVSLTKEATIPPFTRIWTQKDYKGRVYFGWGDSRLAKDESLWIEKYS